eukprot:6584831-Prymnesium_polylepis.1
MVMHGALTTTELDTRRKVPCTDQSSSSSFLPRPEKTPRSAQEPGPTACTEKGPSHPILQLHHALHTCIARGRTRDCAAPRPGLAGWGSQ